MLWQTELKKWLQKCSKLVVLGIGNPLREDDALGLEVLKLLRGRVPKRARLVECGTMPENFTGEVKRFKPSHVLLIDAASFNAKPGAVRLVPPGNIGGVAVSTHALPLSMFAEVVQKMVKAKVLLLGVQPKKVEFVEGLTPEVEEAVNKVADALVDLLADVCR
ncbi:MAG TPA: hydrogenase maturation peptidase HycI [Candidatus Krumholzibacteriaceae bacterium]|jgi:hydrogenase 3 maturation protease|nr:hydrogenase maturation peptidase HycI [Candidatus Krumholzibacteriaceae bacterium]